MTTTLFGRITVNQSQCGGRPCIRGMRIRVRDVLDMLANRASRAEILADFPDLLPEDTALRSPTRRATWITPFSSQPDLFNS
jgi:uncharacterized protein (DUF433 family)